MIAMRNVFLTIMWLGAAKGMAQIAATISEADHNNIEYPTVQYALRALHSKPGVTFRTENGWTIAEEVSTQTIWSFAPVGHPAYPTVVKRALVIANGLATIKLDIMCNSGKVACDSVVVDFQQLNERMRDAIHKKFD